MRPRVIIIGLVTLIAIAGVWAYHTVTTRNARDAALRAEIAKDKGRATPVILAQVLRRDVPVWLENVGVVSAYNSVTVRPRVSGTLDSVNFVEGQHVSRNDVLAQIDPRPYRAILAQASAKKAQDEAQLTHARRELDRINALVKLDAESQRLLDQQQANVNQLVALVQADQAAVEAAQLDLDFTTVRAPIAGRTGFRHVDAGNTVTANQPDGLVVLTQLQPISVVFPMPQKHLAALRVEMQKGKPLAVQAVIDETGEVVGTGTLSLIDNQVDVSTDNVRFKATFPNEDGALWPGQYVLARVLLRTIKDAVLVPAESVIQGVDSQMVYVANAADSTVQMRTVVSGPEFKENGETWRVIESGLKADEVIIREGQNKLKSGSKYTEVKATAK